MSTDNLPAPAPNKMTVEELATTIKSKVSTMLQIQRRAGDEVGDLLVEAKTRVGHGNFEAWVKDHCSMSYRSARRYMQMAKDRTKIEPQLKLANVASLPAPTPPSDSSDSGSGSGSGSGSNTTPAGQYDKLEGQLLKKLKDLNVNEVREHAAKTIGALNDTVDDIESASRKDAKLSAVVRQ
jgi:hypothetical protein